jgi:glycosyltransferase 2 family protein
LKWFNLLSPKKLWVTWVPHVAIALFFIFCYFGFQKELNKISLESLPRAYDIYLLVVGMVLVSYFVRAMRWRQYLQTLGYEVPPLYSVLTYVAGFAYTLAPGKVGELMKASYYRPYKIPMTVVSAAFFVERLTDLAVFVCLALVFLGFVAQGYGFLLIVAGSCAPVAILLTALIPESLLKEIAQTPCVRSANLGYWVLKLADALEAAKKLLTFKLLMLGLFLGCCGWLFECLSLYFLGVLVTQSSFTIGDAIGMYAAAIVVGAVSFLPGGLGTTEAAMVALLVNYGLDISEAVILTMVCRLLTLWVAVLLGWIAVGVLKLSRKEELL